MNKNSIWDRLEEAAGVLDEPCHHVTIAGHLCETAAYGRKLEEELKKLKMHVRSLLDDVNQRYPEKNPREWNCKHMQNLDNLVPLEW